MLPILIQMIIFTASDPACTEVRYSFLANYPSISEPLFQQIRCHEA
jgi:hypothetical protein